MFWPTGMLAQMRLRGRCVVNNAHPSGRAWAWCQLALASSLVSKFLRWREFLAQKFRPRGMAKLRGRVAILASLSASSVPLRARPLSKSINFEQYAGYSQGIYCSGALSGFGV